MAAESCASIHAEKERNADGGRATQLTAGLSELRPQPDPPATAAFRSLLGRICLTPAIFHMPTRRAPTSQPNSANRRAALHWARWLSGFRPRTPKDRMTSDAPTPQRRRTSDAPNGLLRAIRHVSRSSRRRQASSLCLGSWRMSQPSCAAWLRCSRRAT